MSQLIDVVKGIDRNLVLKLSLFERNFSNFYGLQIVEKMMIQNDTQARESFPSHHFTDVSVFMASRKGSNCAT